MEKPTYLDTAVGRIEHRLVTFYLRYIKGCEGHGTYNVRSRLSQETSLKGDQISERKLATWQLAWTYPRMNSRKYVDHC